MNTLRHSVLCFAVLAIAFSFGECSKTSCAADVPQVDMRMNGTWELSPELNALLGFEDDELRSDAVDHPVSFKLTIDQTLTESLTREARETFGQFCEEMFCPMGHQVIATGQWQTKFRVDPGISTDCYITQHHGRTYIWVSAPFVVLYGGQISFINGSSANRDVVVLDFNPNREPGAPNIAGYRRSTK